MTYPPETHILRDLAPTGERRSDRSTTVVPLQPGLLVDGRLRLGVLATVIDLAGAGIALAAVHPDWIATADLVANLHAPVTTGPIEVACTPMRVGAGRVVVDAVLHDGTGARAGAGRMAFARIPGSATRATVETATGSGPVRHTMEGGTPLDDPVTDRCGFVAVGPGQLRFDKGEYVQNSFGTVNGGVMALACEAAAVSAAGGGHAVDLHVHYLEQVGDGPVAVTAEVVRVDPGGALTTVRAVDRADGRVAAVADVRVAREPTGEG